MEQAGSLKSLAERMQEKAEQERIETEKVFTEQLRILSGNLQESSKNALRTMSDAMAREITNATEALNRQYNLLSLAFSKKWVSMLALGLSLCLGMTLAGWGMVKIGSWRLNSYRTELAQLKQECQTQRETLETLKAGAWGVTLQESENGRFIVLPAGMKSPDPAQLWNVGNRKAIRME